MDCGTESSSGGIESNSGEDCGGAEGSSREGGGFSCVCCHLVVEVVIVVPRLFQLPPCGLPSGAFCLPLKLCCRNNSIAELYRCLQHAACSCDVRVLWTHHWEVTGLRLYQSGWRHIRACLVVCGGKIILYLAPPCRTPNYTPLTCADWTVVTRLVRVRFWITEGMP